MSTFPLPIDIDTVGLGADAATSFGTSVAANASTNTKGSYVELSASLADDVDALVLMADHAGGATADGLIDLAVGGAGSEQVIVENLLIHRGNQRMTHSVLLPVRVPDGSRLSTRVQSSDTTDSLRIALHAISGGFNYPIFADELVTLGASTGDSGGQSIDSGGSSNTKGSYVQITADAGEDLSGFFVAFSNQNNSARTSCGWLVDVALGAAASEQIIVPDIFLEGSAGGDVVGPVYSPIYHKSIPSGTRIAARSQCSITNAADRLIDIAIYGIPG